MCAGNLREIRVWFSTAEGNYTIWARDLDSFNEAALRRGSSVVGFVSDQEDRKRETWSDADWKYLSRR